MNSIKTVAAIHDLSCFGHSSLSVIMPLFASFGIRVSPLPTALLSTHTAYENPHIVDLSHEIKSIYSHWEKLGLSFDALYSGYLGNPRESEIILEFFERFRNQNNLVLVDPVLGDDGKLYETFNNDMVESMKQLVSKADIITPNLTEASLLLGESFSPHPEEKVIHDYLKRLADLGPKNILLTGIFHQEKNHPKITTYSYQKESREIHHYTHSCSPINYPGTGDAFATLFLGFYLQGKSFLEATQKALKTIEKIVQDTFQEKRSPQEGLIFERLTKKL